MEKQEQISKNNNKAKNLHKSRIQLICALIGFAGLIAAAIITRPPKVTTPPTDPTETSSENGQHDTSLIQLPISKPMNLEDSLRIAQDNYCGGTIAQAKHYYRMLDPILNDLERKGKINLRLSEISDQLAIIITTQNCQYLIDNKYEVAKLFEEAINYVD